jgi:hypothetical protein
MKNIFLLILTCALSSSLFAQGNLQFNQVKLVSAVQTVPTGKVWKIESIIYNTQIVTATAWPDSYNGTTTNVEAANILLNGVSITTRKSSSSAAYQNANSLVWETKLPIWLPAGTTLASSTGVYSLSIIEFNIIP